MEISGGSNEGSRFFRTVVQSSDEVCYHGVLLGMCQWGFLRNVQTDEGHSARGPDFTVSVLALCGGALVYDQEHWASVYF